MMQLLQIIYLAELYIFPYVIYFYRLIVANLDGSSTDITQYGYCVIETGAPKY